MTRAHLLSFLCVPLHTPIAGSLNPGPNDKSGSESWLTYLMMTEHPVVLGFHWVKRGREQNMFQQGSERAELGKVWTELDDQQLSGMCSASAPVPPKRKKGRYMATWSFWPCPLFLSLWNPRVLRTLAPQRPCSLWVRYLSCV